MCFHYQDTVEYMHSLGFVGTNCRIWIPHLLKPGLIDTRDIQLIFTSTSPSHLLAVDLRFRTLYPLPFPTQRSPRLHQRSHQRITLLPRHPLPRHRPLHHPRQALRPPTRPSRRPLLAQQCVVSCRHARCYARWRHRVRCEPSV